MRLYGGRLIRKNVRKQVASSRELRNAVVCYVYPDDQYCQVKIQGSDQLITAYYPENWESTPQYLKRGNAVLITTPGGNKGRIEVSGHGFLIPTAIPGGTGAPTVETSGDCIVSGCEVFATDPEGMQTIVGDGTIRINGTNYALAGLIMDRSDVTMDIYNLILDEVGGVLTHDAASSTQFRYDKIEAGTDGVCAIVKGTGSTGEPTMPSTTSNHVSLGHVLLYPNMTEITNGDIGRKYTAPEPSRIEIIVADDDLAWAETSTTITINMRDQYGNLVSLTGGYEFVIEWESGNGTLQVSGYDALDENSDYEFYTTSDHATVTYTRDQEVGDVSPTFTITENRTGLSSSTYIILRDAGGDMMFG
jgi:hypothetical protein